MAKVTKKCDACGKEYEGHHKSKWCLECKADPPMTATEVVNRMNAAPRVISQEEAMTPTESYAKDVGEYKDSLERSAIVDAPFPIGSDVVVEGVANEPTPIDGDWQQYGMCEDGYEVFPGWVWSQKKLVCVSGDAPREVLEMMQDAFQRRVVNRKPVLGDADYGNKEKSL